ncbi:MAG: hypothetical protein ACXVCP_12985 [Bdellovibrio sp.]
MKNKNYGPHFLRMLTVVLLLAAFPFFIVTLSKKASTERHLASDNMVNIDREHDLSNLSPEEFGKAFKYEILRGAFTEENQFGTGLRLGLFYLQDSQKQKRSVCDIYPVMDLLFTADGIAVSGEVPQMIVRGPCALSEDQSYIKALPVPFKEILSASPQQFVFESTPANNGTKIFFRNVLGSWPSEWTWTGVVLYEKDSQKQLQINGYEIISVLGAPLILKANE